MTPREILRNLLQLRIIDTGRTDHPEPGTSEPLIGDHLHIWSARYSDLDRCYPVLSDIVSTEETARAAGFKKTRDAQNYLLRKGMVRAILGPYIRKEPREVRFVHGESGKPDLYPAGEVQDIRFSLSHTDEMVCLGISRKSRIGLDIVKRDSLYPFSATAQYLFTRGELQWMTRTSSHEQHIRFFRIWSLKEALLKAMGGGAGMMQETEVSGIMKNRSLDGFYPVSVGKMEMVAFIHESGSGSGIGHHCTLVTIPATNTGSPN
jgi:4'-phosphopantetheinyl transferase